MWGSLGRIIFSLFFTVFSLDFFGFLWFFFFLILSKIHPTKPPKSTPKSTQKPPKSTPKAMKIQILKGMRFGADFCPNCAASWGRLGGVLSASWGVLGASWGVLGASWGRPGASWGCLGASWARLEGLLARPGRMVAFCLDVQ